MKVEFSSNIGAYRKNQPASASKAQAASTTAKTDVAEFSRGAVAAPDKALAGAKSAILSGVSSSAGESRLEALRQSVRDGSYHVSTQDLADAILDLSV